MIPILVLFLHEKSLLKQFSTIFEAYKTDPALTELLITRESNNFDENPNAYVTINMGAVTFYLILWSLNHISPCNDF